MKSQPNSIYMNMVHKITGEIGSEIKYRNGLQLGLKIDCRYYSFYLTFIIENNLRVHTALSNKSVKMKISYYALYTLVRYNIR